MVHVAWIYGAAEFHTKFRLEVKAKTFEILL